MRILHTINSVDPAGGGPIEGIQQLAAMTTARGCTVEVASLDSPSAPFLKGFPLTVHPLGPGRLKYAFSPHLVPWLSKNAANYDIVIVNGIWQFQCFGAWLALHNQHVPYVVFTHGMLDPWFKRQYPLKHLKKWLYWPWSNYRALRDASAVIFTCDEERRLARESFWLYRAKEVVINYGTAGASGDPARQKAAFLQRFPALEGKRLALFLGRINPKKGCDLLIRGFAQAFRDNPDWHLVMAGPDRDGWRSALLKIAKELNIADRITWTDLITGDLKWGALRSAEVFVLPSHQENFGISVAEALSCGVPALISDKVNIWAEIKEDGGGLVASDTVDGVCSLLNQWSALTSGERLLMGLRARTCFEHRFEITAAAQTLLRVLSSICTEANVTPRLRADFPARA